MLQINEGTIPVLSCMTSLAKISVLIMLMPVAAWAFQHENQSYLPLSKAELNTRFPVTYAGTLSGGRPGYFEETKDKQLPERLKIGTSEATVSETDNGLVISGKDKANRDWSVNLGDSALAHACRFYIGDLDRNGIRDAIIVFPTGGNGLAPTSHLFSLTFDESGRPVPFEADGYFQELNEGIFDLVDLDRDSRAELIYMNFDGGYWVTNLYEVRDARWQRIKGQHAGRNYPLHTRFTYRPNQKPVAPKRGRHPFAPDLSNASPMLQGQLISYQWADVSRSEDIVLIIEDNQGKKISSKPISWYASFALVLDDKEGRRIISLSASEATLKSALSEIIKKGYRVSLYGQRRADISSPEILWASSNL
jgi:hypothetical protein